MSVWSSSLHPQEQSAFTTKTQVVWLRFFQVVWLRFFGHSHFYEVSFLHYTRSDFLAAGSFLEVPFFSHSLALIFGTRSALCVLFFLHFLAPFFGPQSVFWSAILSYTFFVPIFWVTVSFRKCHFILHLLVPIFWAAVSFRKCHFILHPLAPIFATVIFEKCHFVSDIEFLAHSHFQETPFSSYSFWLRFFWPPWFFKRRHFVSYTVSFGFFSVTVISQLHLRKIGWM